MGFAGTMWFCCCKSTQPTRPATTRTVTTPRAGDATGDTGDQPRDGADERLHEAKSTDNATESENAERKIAASEGKEDEETEEKADGRAVEKVEEVGVESEASTKKTEIS